ncbi:N-acetylmuramoyl-L-alanine amidase [Ruminococcaceae bacterium FB2012]|nr:N-acetylmuramoyl-L-alanine amidase [Ruminococcaceae bacterium FB2012]
MKLRQKLLTYLFAGAVIAAGIVGYEIIDGGVKTGRKAVETSAETVLQRPVIVLDAGHGGADGGCVSVNGIPEKNINLSILLTTRDMLDLLGYDVRCTRETDVSIHDQGIEGLAKQKKSDMDNRLAIINESGAELAVSIHQNQFTDPKYSGAQMFFKADSPESSALADILRERFRVWLQPDNERETKPVGSELFLIHNAKCPAVMAECGFLSNPAEASKLETPNYQQEVAMVIADGINCYVFRKRQGADR